RFTYEDVSLLDAIAAHVAAMLRSLQLIQELSETRESQLMSQWSRMMLHDLKNHLTPLRMVSRNLRECSHEPDAIETCATDLERAAQRLEHLVRTLSELREIPRLQIRSCCPNRIVRDALGELQVEKRNGIELDLALNAERSVYADDGMLRRVVENLITNAIEAMDGQGSLAIRTEDHRENARDEVHISVADTGCGIPAEFIRERLFRPFATTKKKGLGLGLYQSRSIVRAHDGQLTVRSTVGQGTAFRIALRAAPPPTRKQVEPLRERTLIEGEAVP
ncbi:MAG: hypothetical protein GF330_05940, partial [Candidatus Eisenbacteria bacterium]|nr:hypothetical protein [Candidatus Eisenbacteria bacterium]